MIKFHEISKRVKGTCFEVEAKFLSIHSEKSLEQSLSELIRIKLRELIGLSSLNSYVVVSLPLNLKKIGLNYSILRMIETFKSVIASHSVLQHLI